MKFRYWGRAVLVAAVAVPLLALAASPLDQLKGVAAGAAGGGAGSAALLGQLGSGSFELGSTQNVVGVLAWCQSRGYAPSATETIKNKLMGRMGMSPASEQDADYKQGAIGVLQDARGGTFDLSRFKDVAGRKVCSSLADQVASSLLGG